MGELRDRMEADLRLRGYAEKDPPSQVDLSAEQHQVRETVKKTAYTGKTYNSLENISQFFAERGIKAGGPAYPPRQVSPPQPLKSSTIPSLVAEAVTCEPTDSLAAGSRCVSETTIEKIMVVAPTMAVPMSTGLAVALNVLPAPSFSSSRSFALVKSTSNP